MIVAEFDAFVEYYKSRFITHCRAIDPTYEISTTEQQVILLFAQSAYDRANIYAEIHAAHRARILNGQELNCE